MTDFRTPLKRIRHFGAAGHGVEHFIGQKASALALAVLAPVFLIGIAFSALAGPVALLDFISGPMGALLCLFFFTVATFHMRIGMATVIEDYVHARPALYACLLANAFVSYGVWIAVSFAILYLAFTG